MAAVAYPIPHDRRVPPQRALRLVPQSERRRVSRPLPPRTYARRRAAAVLLVTGGLLPGRAGLGFLGGGPPPAPEPLSTATPAAARSVVVQPGDTLWSIARRLQPEGDVRVTVQRLTQ